MEQSQQSRFITYLSVFSVVAAVFFIIEDVSNLVMLNSLSSRPEYHMAEQMMPSLSVSPSGTIFEIFMQTAGIIASIAMFNRLNWGRVMFIAVLSIITGWGIISSYLSYQTMSQYLDTLGMGGSLTFMILANALILGITIYIVWKLTTNDVRNEFLKR